ncbi:LytR family transcriptional regulator, partial [Streptomyces scabiei]
GDYGRQKRQRQVVEAIIKKSINFKTAFTYQKILKSLESNVKMNLTWDNLTSMQSTYTKALSNIKSDQLAGTGEMIDGVSYQIVS